MTDLLGNPLPGFIHPEGWPRPAGSLDFEETSTLAQHLASGRAAGCDFGNGRTGAWVVAMLAGVVYQKYTQHTPGQVGDGANIVRIRQPSGRNQGYAHLLNFAADMRVGLAVARGHLLGWVGMSGAPGQPHLHCHDQDAAGAHHEVYAELEQTHAIQVNPGSVPNIRLAPGLAGSIWGVARLDGIYHGATRVAAHDVFMLPRPAVQVAVDGYIWLPRRLLGVDVWIARPFVHFV